MMLYRNDEICSPAFLPEAWCHDKDIWVTAMGDPFHWLVGPTRDESTESTGPVAVGGYCMSHAIDMMVYLQWVSMRSHNHLGHEWYIIFIYSIILYVYIYILYTVIVKIIIIYILLLLYSYTIWLYTCNVYIYILCSKYIVYTYMTHIYIYILYYMYIIYTTIYIYICMNVYILYVLYNIHI